jgi:rhodanese-related sulfurtransferase
VSRGIGAAALRERLAGDAELALLDAREQGVHYRGHPFFACSAPLSRLEMRVGDLVPRRTAPIVLLDGGGGEDLAERAAARLAGLGYTSIEILEGGCAAWRAAGGELFSGVNVPSKAFGEFVEHRYDTPRIPPEELKRLRDAGTKMVILDSRPFEEYHRMSIPGGVDVPGAELAWRVHDLAPDPDTLVVVNCAGRTRSIIGCQSLRNAGIANRVVALKDGTMGWELAGFAVERGATRVAPPPSREGRERARAAAARVAARFRVKTIPREAAQRWLADPGRTTYLLDVRTREEYEALRIAGARHAPGGQLVQATDEYVGVRRARIVLIDPERVRAVMTASWLAQMGWDEVGVLECEDGFGGWRTESGPRRPQIPGLKPWPLVSPRELDPAAVTLVDFSTSLRFRERHAPLAWWAVRARLGEARARIGDAAELVLTSEDGLLAQLAAPEAQALWPRARVRVLEGGNAAWFAAGRPAEAGIERATTALDDLWYKPYDHVAGYEERAREYLTWEVALVEQIRREPAVRFRAFE